jgi:hypothetical protein
MITLMPDMPGNTIGVVASGEVTASDYETVLMPAVEVGIKEHGRVRVLYQIAPDFTGFTAGAMWDDARMGLAHFNAWEKAAVVTDVEWIRGSVTFFRFLMPCPVRVFGNDALAEAREWILA